MKTKKIHFRSTSRAVALEPRLLFDGAGAVAAVDGMDDFDFDEQLNDGLVKDVHEAGSEQQSIVNDGDAIEIIDGDDSLHIPSSLGNRLGLEAEQENILAGTEEQSLLIIDSRVDNHELLLESVGSSVTVVVVGEGESGLDAISNALAGSSGYDAIHIISHGTPGSFTLGTDLVDSSSIQQNSEQLQSWANHLNAGADILLYGCDVAQGETGQSFIEQLTAITGADIAASTNATGSAEKGGDWVLERSTGSIEAGVFGFAGYGELLADATFSDTQLPTVPREVSEDATFTLQNFTVAGSGTLSVTITLTEDNKAPASGSFTLGTTTGLAFQTGDGTADTAMTFTGTATDINAALATLTYNPTANFNGAAKLAVVSGGSSKDIAINVTPVNDAPNFAPPAAGDAAVAQVAEEGADSTVTLTPSHFGIDSTSNATLGLFDPDLDPALSTIVNQTPDQIVFEVKNVPGQGRLTGAGNAPLLAGSLFSLQDLKEGKIKYQHFDNEVRADKWANSDKDSFVLTVRDGAGGEMDGTVNIKINPVNDAPSISGSVAGGIIAYEGRNGVPISVTVTDVDQLDENGNWTFTFSDLNLTGSGTRLYLDNDNDGKFSAGDTQINNGSTFTGTQADLNAKLKIDISDAEPTAAISFKVSVTDDGGGEGVGAVKTTTATITINPRENNDHPLLTTNTAPDLGSAYYAGDNVHTITAAQLKTLLGVTDADSPKDTLTYTLVTNVIAESGSTGTVYLLNKDNKYMGSGNSFTQAQLEAGEISIVFTGSGQNTSHFDFQIRDGELTAFSTVKQTEWTPKAIEGSTRDSTDDNYLTHSFYVRFDVPGAGGSGSGPDPANQAPIVGTIVGITANELNESGTTLLYGGTNVGVGKPGIVITDADNADSELTIRLEKVPTGGHIELKVSGSWQTVPLFGSFTYAQLKASEVRYVHDGGEQFLSSNLGFAFSVSDGSALPVTPPIGGDAGSGNNFSVEADPVNDTPSVSASGTGMVLEGGTLTFNTAGNPSISLSDVDGSGDAAPTGLDTWKSDTGVDELYVTVNFTTNTGTPANDLNGKLYYNGTEVANGATLKQSEVQSDKFTYVHDGSENHSGKFTLTVNDAQLKDGTSPHATSVGNTLAVNIQIAPLNDTPSIDPSTPDAPGTAGTLNTGMRLHEGGSGVIAGTNGGSGYASAGIAFKGNTDSSTKSQLVSIDPDNSDTQIQYKILTNTTHGKLSLNGKVLGAGSTFTQADLNNGLVKYTHDASESAGEGIITDKFQFQVGDSGPGTYPKGWFDIEILPANDRPTVEAPSSQPIIVDTTNSGSGVLIKGTGGKTFSVDDVDSVDGAGTKDFLQVTVRLLDEHGDPVPDYTGVTFGYTNQTGGDWAKIKDGNASILQFQGSKTQVNTALAGLTVKFADDRDARYQIEVIVDDRARENDGSLKTADYANGGKYNEPTTPGGSSGAISTAEFDWATNIKVPTTTSADGYGNINSSTVEIWASNENDKPVVAVPGSAVVVHEDKRTPISGITYADPDAFDSTNNTLTLTVSNGTLWFSANESDKSVPGGAGATGVGTASVTLTGSKAQLDAALAQLHYQGDLDFNGIDQIVVIVDDGGNYGKDGTDTSGGSSAGTVTIHILPVNDAPTLTLPNENSYLQVTGGSFVLSDSTNPIAIADNKDFSNDLAPSQQDGKDDNFTVTLTLIGTGTNLGTITLDEPGSITTGNNTASVTLTGSRSDINTALAAGVTYSDGGQNIDGTVKLTVTVNDNANGGEALEDPDSKQDGIGGALTDSKILYLQPTDKNDAPSFDGLNNTPTYVQNSNNPVVLDSNATLVDPELDLFGANGNWNGAELTLQRDGGASSYDIFGFTVSGSTGVNVSGSELRIGTTKVGTVTNTNGVLTINFSSNPTAAQVDQVLRAITYSNTDPAPADTVQINYSIRDGNNNIAPTGSDPVGPNGNGQDQGTGGELTGTGSITVKINRQVIAEPDSKTITEGGATTDTTTITGDITPGTTNSNDNGGSQDRDPDADQTIVVQGVKHGTQGSVSAVGTAGVGTTVSGTYGSIVINADGSYTYTLDNTNLAVQALVPDETLTDVFSYAINDSLGANSTTAFSTLTITINGADDGVTVNVPNTTTQTTPDDVKTDHVVFESGLAGGQCHQVKRCSSITRSAG